MKDHLENLQISLDKTSLAVLVIIILMKIQCTGSISYSFITLNKLLILRIHSSYTIYIIYIHYTKIVLSQRLKKGCSTTEKKIN